MAIELEIVPLFLGEGGSFINKGGVKDMFRV